MPTVEETVQPVVMLESDAILLAESLLLSVPTKEVTADPATLNFFTVPESARSFPLIGSALVADTKVTLRPGAVAYNGIARERNIPANRIKAANRWASPMLSALRLMADTNAEAGARAVALGLLSAKDIA